MCMSPVNQPNNIVVVEDHIARMDISVTEYKRPGFVRSDSRRSPVSGKMDQITPAYKRNHLAKQTKTVRVLEWTMLAAEKRISRDNTIMAGKSRSKAVKLLNIATKRARDPKLHEKT